MAAISLIALSIQGCSPSKPDDSAAAPTGVTATRNEITEVRDPATGNIVKTQEFKNGTLLASKEWTSDGKTLISDIRWVDGKVNGWEKRRTSYASGELELDWVWKDGVLSGFSEQREKNSRDRTEAKDGIRTRKVYELHDGAEFLVMEETYRAYKRDGILRVYSHGELVSETEYSNGKLVRSTDTSIIEELDEDLAFELCTNLIANEYRGDKNADGTIPEAIYADWERQCSE